MTRALAILFLLCAAAFAGDVPLHWDFSPDPDVASYNVYCGVQSRQYTNSFSVGLTNSATVSNLCSGVIYFFAVTAVDTNGIESDFSNELTISKPAAPTLNSSSVTIYFPFNVRQSPDLTNWSTNTVTGSFNVPIGASNDFFQIIIPGFDTTLPVSITPSP